MKTRSRARLHPKRQMSLELTGLAGALSPSDPADLTQNTAPAMTSRQKRQLERAVAWTMREWLSCLRYRLLLEWSDHQYAARRVIELRLQLPQ